MDSCYSQYFVQSDHGNTHLGTVFPFNDAICIHPDADSNGPDKNKLFPFKFEPEPEWWGSFQNHDIWVIKASIARRKKVC